MRDRVLDAEEFPAFHGLGSGLLNLGLMLRLDGDAARDVLLLDATLEDCDDPLCRCVLTGIRDCES